MNNIFQKPPLIVGEHVCRCCGNDLRFFNRYAANEYRMNALKSQLN